MKICPAIDIKNGKCVRLIKGDFKNKTEYEMSPIEQANKYKDHGFKNLHVVDLDGALLGETVNKKPLLGICVGLQMFADVGYEETETKGLGWTSGKVSKIDNQNGKYKLPHIGWNQINILKDSKIFKQVENNSHMYFVHSYEFVPTDKTVISATTDYSTKVVCSVEKENLFGTQFHPEKSDKTGLKVINNFINL